MKEHFEHDVCPKCGTKSLPAEKVTDQTLRYCPKCHHEWFEDLTQPPTQAFHRENLPGDVALLLAAHAVPREKLSDRFITICNQSPLDGKAIYDELCRCVPDNKELRTSMAQLEVLMLINGKK